MAELRIDFEWWRDPRGRGYRLLPRGAVGHVEYHPPLRRPNLPKFSNQWGLVYLPYGIRVLSTPDRPLYVVHVGDGSDEQLQAYRPLDRFGSLFSEFAKVSTPEDVLNFIKRFGPLTKDGLDPKKGELVNGVIIHAEALRELLTSASSGERQNLVALVAGQYNPFAGLEVNLDIDPADISLRLRLTPASLLDALWLQAVQELTSGATVRQCRYCGQWFETGVGAGRRLDAKFCSDKHRVAFNSLKRSNRR